MKIKQAISSAILVVLLTAPTAWAQDNIRAAMESANKEWSAAYNSMNGKAFPTLYTKDAILMPPGAQPINGSEAIGQFWTDLIKAGNRKNFAIEIASIQRDGKYAYQTARWTLDQVKDNGEVTKVGGIASVFSKNSRTASGWPRSTFTIFIKLGTGWIQTAQRLVYGATACCG
jgi:ketosteroid isomerase-like protein